MIPMKTALPAKKFTAADDPDAPDTVVDTAAADDPDAAVAVVAFAAEIITLVVANVSPNEGSRSKGTPNDLDVAARAFMGSGENAKADDKNNNGSNNSTSLNRETIVIDECAMFLPNVCSDVDSMHF